ncbi:MAG: NosD domain-containing protein [Candidatus Bathyarchaeota archaeon]
MTLCLTVFSISEIGIVKADEKIFIRADGSVEGIDTIQRTGNIYTFTDHIVNQSIVVEKDDIVVDGAGYTIQGTGAGTGIGLDGRSNVTIKNVEITNFRYGIMLMSSSNNVLVNNNPYSNTWAGIQLGYSSNNSISGNNVANNSEDGIALYSSSFNNIFWNKITSHNRDGVAFYYWSNNNTLSGNNITNSSSTGIRVDLSSFNAVSGNNITDNNEGIFLWSSNHKIYHNNFINNTNDAGSFEQNIWDDGYPSGGNYWSSFNGTDSNRDGIGDTPYIIDENNQDNNPLKNPVDIQTIPEYP